MDSKYKTGSLINGSSPQKNGPSQDDGHLPKKFRSDDSPHSKGYSNSSINKHRRSLPVFAVKNRLLDEINNSPTIIIIGETGSGKTTQIPQYIHEARLEKAGAIAITQPRRVAAITVALRVATEMGCAVGHTVGYAVRFEDVTRGDTKLKYLTDGMLLREALSDNLLMMYNVIILDEAHERTIHTDVLFGIVKQAQSIRRAKNFKPLKVILMSATMDVDHFSAYFDDAPIVYLQGRQYPVDIMRTTKSHEDYNFAILVTVFQIHREAPPNEDILVFLTGQEEIEAMVFNARLVAKDLMKSAPHLRVLPLYAALAQFQQLEVLRPGLPNTRKLILSTNIAETSITIPGVKYVIDSGMVKLRTHNPMTGMDSLKVQRISKAQAWQRAGRAGREGPGTCYRMYTEEEYNKMAEMTVPEIQRCNLSGVVLQLLAMGVNALSFDFMDKPPTESIMEAMRKLSHLNAILSVNHPELTPLGRQMATFPLDPHYSRVILAAWEMGCVEEVVTLVAVLSGENLRVTVSKRREDAAAAHQKFVSSTGDHITNLNIFRAYNSAAMKKQFCFDNFLNNRNLEYAGGVRSQLLDLCRHSNIPISSCGQDSDCIRKCLIAGLFGNLAQLQREGHYLTVGSNQVVAIHPSSVLFRSKPPLVIYGEVVQTGRCYMRQVSSIDPDWVAQMAPTEFQRKLCLNGAG
ncbi:ATP-dependent RNA helicase DHX33 [Hetaerina americana]|uniref:ATP-dependent RNA helicase DHX33 n=1 Tax=Hetaerina americana TaxID=62018 RepID=UPI003A7F49CD